MALGLGIAGPGIAPVAGVLLASSILFGAQPGVSARSRDAVAKYFRRFVASGGLPLDRVSRLCQEAGFVEPYLRRMEESLCIYVRAGRS